MKTTLLALFVFGANLLYAQLVIKTNLRENGIYDKENSKWNIISTDEGTTIFTFDKDFKYFIHSTDDIVSKYTINESKYNKDELLIDMEVTSDANNIIIAWWMELMNSLSFFIMILIIISGW